MQTIRRILTIVFSLIFLYGAVPPTIHGAPESKAVVGGSLAFSPRGQVEVGQKVTITATIAKRGEIKEEARFSIEGPDEELEMDEVKIKEKSKKYEVTGTFIPEEPGKYTIKLSLFMEDEDGQEIEALVDGSIRINSKWIYYYVPENGNHSRGTIYKDRLEKQEALKVSKANHLTGEIHQDEDGIYYLRVTDPRELGGIFKSTLYTIKHGRNTPEALEFAGKKITSLSVVDGYIHFTAYTSDNKFVLYKSKRKSDKKEIVRENVDFATVSDDWYYFHDSVDQGLYKMRLDGTDETKLTDDDTKIYINQSPIGVYTDAISFRDSNFKHVLMTKDGKILKDMKALNGYIVEVVDGSIYYSTHDNALYRAEIDSDEKEKIVDFEKDAIVEINVAKQYVLYMKKNKELYKVKW